MTKNDLANKIKQTKNNLVGISLSLDLLEKDLTMGIRGIVEMRGACDALLYNLRFLKRKSKITSIEAYRQSVRDLDYLKSRIKQALTIYNNIKKQRDGHLGRYDKLMEYLDRIQQNWQEEATILPFRKLKNERDRSERENQEEDR